MLAGCVSFSQITFSGVITLTKVGKTAEQLALQRYLE
jgi:hypothetical protein